MTCKQWHTNLRNALFPGPSRSNFRDNLCPVLPSLGRLQLVQRPANLRVNVVWRAHNQHV